MVRAAIMPAVPRAAPDLEMLVWDGPTAEVEVPVRATRAATPVCGAPAESATFRTDPMRRTLRDRYIKARFPGAAESSADLEDGARIVKAVRLFFEEQKFDRADELLELAIEQTPLSRTLRLAQLELAFLRRERASFTTFARDFRRVFPAAPEWLEIARLGRALAPLETTLFGDAQGARAQDSYGPWPDMPNWLQASWDLTPEILGADFHREMARPQVPQAPLPERSAA